MKRILISLFLLTSLSSFALDTHLRVGVMTTTTSYNKEDNSFEGYAPTVGVELTQSLLLFDFGAGIAYNGKMKGSEIGTVPAYLLAKWNIIPVAVKPYLVAKIGTTLYTQESVTFSNPDGRLYYGIGAGIELSPLQLELLYSKTEIKNDRRGNDDLEQISLTFGYKLF